MAGHESSRYIRHKRIVPRLSMKRDLYFTLPATSDWVPRVAHTIKKSERP